MIFFRHRPVTGTRRGDPGHSTNRGSEKVTLPFRGDLFDFRQQGSGFAMAVGNAKCLCETEGRTPRSNATTPPRMWPELGSSRDCFGRAFRFRRGHPEGNYAFSKSGEVGFRSRDSFLGNIDAFAHLVLK